MLRGSLLAIAVILGLSIGTSRGDGLIYQLPGDGAWAEFQGEFTVESGFVLPIEVVIKSVGRKDDADQPLRWIELKVPADAGDSAITKLLIPEKQLREGAAPIENVVRGWHRAGKDSAKALQDGRGFWQQILLADSLHNVQPLEKATIESKLGTLACEGLTGHAVVEVKSGYGFALTYEVRRHPKAPFGVVACRIECEVKRNGKSKGTRTIELHLTDFGTNAESDLPEYL